MIWKEGVCLAQITAGFLFHVGCRGPPHSHEACSGSAGAAGASAVARVATEEPVLSDDGGL